MKKLFSILSVLTIISSAFADPVYPETTDPGATTANAPTASNDPKYALMTHHDNDSNVASAGYVKGAYNAAMKAVNKVADMVATVPLENDASTRADIWVE